ncbi:MAG TPA: PAS domain S-box protein [Xanthobacteraceae bacterium]|nr:PAS domain S-box protein [Xanthobacteraceae bacterium]
MPQPATPAELLADARIAGLVAVTTPALLIDAEGGLIFANAAGIALLGARTLQDAATRGALLAPFSEAARRFGDSLPAAGAPRLERLRLKGSLQPAVFACSRLMLAGAPAVLFTGIEAGRGKAPSLTDAARALIGDDDAFALFDLDGHLVHANPPAGALIGAAQTLAEIDASGAAALAEAREKGASETASGNRRVFLRRIGTKAQSAILALFGEGEARGEDQSQISQAAPAAVEENPAAEPPKQKMPTRFVWQTDASGRFASVSEDLAAAVGGEQAKIEGLDWLEAAERIGIEGAAAAAAAIARRDTWSGIIVHWPVAASGMMQAIDLAALPVFDRARNFQGYRGFGVFREKVERSAVAEKTPELPREPAEPAAERPPLVLIERPENVVPLRTAPGSELSASERTAFREIAREIGARIDEVNAKPDFGRRPALVETAARAPGEERALLDRMPLGVVVHRAGRVLYANRTLLDWIGVQGIGTLEAEGGLHRLFAGTPALEPGETASALAIAGKNGEPIPVEARLISIPWEGETALAYLLRRANAGFDERMETSGRKLREAEAASRELRSILDTATDGILLIDRGGRIQSLNRSAEALFGYDSHNLEGEPFTRLFAPESHLVAAEYLEGLSANGVASLLNDGREVIGQVREGGLIPLFMTIGRVDDNGEKFCAVFRDITQWKRTEEELLESKRKAEQSNSAKSDFLAKISHEIRTPLNAIIGFADVMREERFGAIGNERYREYLKDIQTSGSHLVSLINDLLDLSKIEAGKLDLAFASVDLNDIARQCMAIMQSQANRERIIIRTSLMPELPSVVADVRSIRQIVLNLLSNSIKFTPPGGQVIVSTQLAEGGEVFLRVRDTGIGMTEAEIAAALEPFRQLSTVGRRTGTGSGLGLPLTKALTEANRASFSLKSNANGGTMAEIAFPPTRVLTG